MSGTSTGTLDENKQVSFCSLLSYLHVKQQLCSSIAAQGLINLAVSLSTRTKFVKNK